VGRWLAFALAGWLAATATATEPQIADPGRELIQRSGLYDQLGQVGPAIEAQIAAQSSTSKLPLDARAALGAALREAYAAEPLRESALATLRRGIRSEHYAATHAWLTSERGRSITRLESLASQPEATSEMQGYAASLQRTPPPPDRVALIQELDRATGTSELMLEMINGTFAATVRGMSAAQGQSISAAEIHAKLHEMRATTQQTVEQAALVSLLFTYRSAPTEELRPYLEFMKSPPGRWYRDLVLDALGAALAQANTRLEARLAKQP
jgi:hypothetical protein